MECHSKKFDGKAGTYQAFRPDYAAQSIPFIVNTCGWEPGFQIADIGAGTGIFTRQLLDAGLKVAAVEPGKDMRAVLQEELGERDGLTIWNAPAECTGLPDHSQDGITAAQAFHWFDPDAFLLECRRILKPGGRLVLLWNMREASHPLTVQAAQICQSYCPNFKGFSSESGWQTEQVEKILGSRFIFKSFSHPISMDKERFVGRYLSSSYAPRPGDAAYAPFRKEMESLFQSHEQEGRLSFPNRTCCYIGQPMFAY